MERLHQSGNQQENSDLKEIKKKKKMEWIVFKSMNFELIIKTN